MGGAQAIFALADGTESVQPVDVIAGPGSRWVQEAKRAVFGKVGIDTLAGPSELMLVAAHDTDPGWAALDLCAQAEHGSDGLLVLAAVEEAVLDAVVAAVERMAAERETVADAPLAVVQVDDLGDAIALANSLAPEHLQLMSEDAAGLAEHVTTAGAVFVGPAARDRIRGLRRGLQPHPPDRRCRPLLRRTGPAHLPAPDRECKLARPGGRRPRPARGDARAGGGVPGARRVGDGAEEGSMTRSATRERSTKETQIRLSLDLDGGEADSATGVGFLDHMLDLVARHARLGLRVEASGDLETGAHHTVEDVGIVFGQALDEALGDRAGIRRYGSALVPMDEALGECAIDISGRPILRVRRRPALHLDRGL